MVPRDDELGLAGTSLSPRLRATADRVGAIVPFFKGATLLAELAGVGLSSEAIERTAEADGRVLSDIAEQEAAGVAAGSLAVLGSAVLNSRRGGDRSASDAGSSGPPVGVPVTAVVVGRHVIEARVWASPICP